MTDYRRDEHASNPGSGVVFGLLIALGFWLLVTEFLVLMGWL